MSAAAVTVRISATIATEYESRCPEDIPEHVRVEGKHSVSIEQGLAMLADAEYNGDSKLGPDEMPRAIGNAYRALAKQLRAAIVHATSEVIHVPPPALDELLAKADKLASALRGSRVNYAVEQDAANVIWLLMDAVRAQAGDAQDAARYRWLRSVGHEQVNVMAHYAGGAMDAAIDAATGVTR